MGRWKNLYGIEVRESGGEILVELWGEFDLFSLADLRRTLNKVLDLQKKTLVNLSGITFLDLASARELAVRAQVYARHLTFRYPSPPGNGQRRSLWVGALDPLPPRTRPRRTPDLL